MGMIDEAMKRQWTPSAQLAMESMKGASQVAANMDKKQTTTYKSASGGGALGGFGGILGTAAGGIIGSIVPGIGTSVGMMAGGALGGAVDNGAAGALQGFGTGMMGAKIPGMFDAGSWGELLGAQTATEQVVANADSVLGASQEVANELTGEKAVWGAVKPEVARSWGF